MFEPKGLTEVLSAMTRNAPFKGFNFGRNGFEFKLISRPSDSWTAGDRPKGVEQCMKLSEPSVDIGYVRQDPLAVRNSSLMTSDECLES